MGDTRHGPRGPKLDMQNFDGTYPEGWVSKMEHLFCIHNIHKDVHKYKMALLYLDVEH